MTYILKSDIWGQNMPINRVIPQEPDEDDLWPDEMSPRADTEEGAHDDLGNETSPNG